VVLLRGFYGVKSFLTTVADLPKSWFALSQFRNLSWGVLNFDLDVPRRYAKSSCKIAIDQLIGLLSPQRLNLNLPFGRIFASNSNLPSDDVEFDRQFRLFRVTRQLDKLAPVVKWLLFHFLFQN
jgi:hypothetical protein